MENDIISLYLIRRSENVSRYAEIFTKYTLKKDIKLDKTINKIIDIYFNNFFLNRHLDYSLLMKYFEIKKDNESAMKDILMASLLFYQQAGLEKQIDDDINTIVILSNIIFLSVSLDEYTSAYRCSSDDVDIRFQEFLDRYRKKLHLSEENMEALATELLTRVKKNNSAEKKFWKCLQNNNFKLDYYFYTKNPNYYLVDYAYDIKKLNRYHQDEVLKMSKTKGISDDILTIYIELLSIFILKNLLSKKFDNYFFMDIYSDYFTKNKNFIAVNRILYNAYVRNHFAFVFNYNDIIHNTSVLKMLAAKGYKIAVKNIDDKMKLATNSFDLIDYVFIKKDIYDSYEQFHSIWQVKEIKFIDIDTTLTNMVEKDIVGDEYE